MALAAFALCAAELDISAGTEFRVAFSVVPGPVVVPSSILASRSLSPQEVVSHSEDVLFKNCERLFVVDPVFSQVPLNKFQ